MLISERDCHSQRCVFPYLFPPMCDTLRRQRCLIGKAFRLEPLTFAMASILSLTLETGTISMFSNPPWISDVAQLSARTLAPTSNEQSYFCKKPEQSMQRVLCTKFSTYQFYHIAGSRHTVVVSFFNSPHS